MIAEPVHRRQCVTALTFACKCDRKLNRSKSGSNTIRTHPIPGCPTGMHSSVVHSTQFTPMLDIVEGGLRD